MNVILRLWHKWCKRSARKMLVMVDLDNIVSKVSISADPRSFSFLDGFDRMLHKLGRIAPIAKVFVYGPPETLARHASWLGKLKFAIVQCDKIITKDNLLISKKDIVDSRMIDDGAFFLREMSEITHLCLWTGDQDFIELAREARMLGKDVVVVASREDTLSQELAKFACKGPDGEKAVYLFSAQAGISS